jgi:hypothetical protein
MMLKLVEKCVATRIQTGPNTRGLDPLDYCLPVANN